MLIESRHTHIIFGAIVIYVLPVIVYKIIRFNLFVQSNNERSNERTHTHTNTHTHIHTILWPIVMLALPVTVYEIIKFYLSKWSRKQFNIMSYIIAEYVIGWHFNGQHDGETMTDLSQTVSCGPTMRRSNA